MSSPRKTEEKPPQHVDKIDRTPPQRPQPRSPSLLRGVSYVDSGSEVTVRFPPGSQFFCAYEKVSMSVPAENGSEYSHRVFELSRLLQSVRSSKDDDGAVTYPPITSRELGTMRILRDVCDRNGAEKIIEGKFDD